MPLVYPDKTSNIPAAAGSNIKLRMEERWLVSPGAVLMSESGLFPAFDVGRSMFDVRSQCPVLV